MSTVKLFIQKNYIKNLSVFIILLFISSCSKATADKNITSPSSELTAMIKVYKNPSCGCCKKWIAHLNQAGFVTETHDRRDVSGLKQYKGIAPRYRSCHTAISQGGFVFEGHVPAKFIKRFLLEKPKNSIGLSVPAMPIGTPGMEVGDRFMPYQVLLLKKDGSSEVYAFIKSSEEQF